MSDRSRRPSARYVYRFTEIMVDPQLGFFGAFTPDALTQLEERLQTEKHEDLIARLTEETRKLFSQLTEYQQLVLRMHLAGSTLIEISRVLGKKGSGDVTKTLYGGWDYQRGKLHGGIVRKLQILAAKSDAIRAILRELEEAKNT